MKNSEKIVFIGAGNLATVLAPSLKGKRNIIQIYSRTSSSAQKLAKLLSCPYTNDLKKINKEADIYIVAVKDEAIEKVASVLRLQGKTVIHTSGSVDMKVLKKVSANYGVLYPPHGFTKGAKLGKNVPFCIEASNAKVKNQLSSIAKDLGGKTYYMNSEQRAKLHLAGVFANNFTNHMLVIADDIAIEAKIPFEILIHLVDDVVAKLKQHKPKLNQTGPAKRKDNRILKKHEQMLKKNPAYLAIYRLISKNIQSIKN
ncbi:MAG TPA: DUF2520 domain-containing protein [Bacteroidia bacterium]|jgi:predicted short-subunit dehydrogenase-like oxidoreductase (DUF2520 family)|nr:DUF2520 domain-containing protein [Bacteroidia bacterium]